MSTIADCQRDGAPQLMQAERWQPASASDQAA
jgi:hypothetical protein